MTAGLPHSLEGEAARPAEREKEAGLPTIRERGLAQER